MDSATVALVEAIADGIEKRFRANPPHPAPWLTSEQGDVYLGKSPGFLTAQRSLGTGPRFVRCSKKFVRYALKDLREWMESHYEQPGQGDES